MALQDNIILQQNDLLQQNRDISKKLLETTSKLDSLVKKNEELTSHVSVGQSTSKVLQEAFSTTSSKLAELERQHDRLEQYLRRECLDFSGIFGSVAPKDLESFLNRKDAENVYSNKKKLKDVDISCLLSDGIQDRNNITTGSQMIGGRKVCPEKKFYITESLPVLQIFVWFS